MSLHNYSLKSIWKALLVGTNGKRKFNERKKVTVFRFQSHLLHKTLLLTLLTPRKWNTYFTFYLIEDKFKFITILFVRGFRCLLIGS